MESKLFSFHDFSIFSLQNQNQNQNQNQEPISFSSFFPRLGKVRDAREAAPAFQERGLNSLRNLAPRFPPGRLVISQLKQRPRPSPSKSRSEY